MKKAVFVAAGVVAITTGVLVWKGRASEAKPESSPDKVIKVERGPIRSVVACTGRVVPNLDVDIKCKASGEVIKLPFDISDPVKKGDLVAELDPVDEERHVRQAEVDLDVSQARLAQAKLNLEVAERNLKTSKLRAEAALESAKVRAQDASSKADRVKQLLEKKLAAQEDYDTAKTAAVQAQADLQNAKAQVEDLKTQEAALELKRQDVKLAEAQVKSDGINQALVQQAYDNTKVYAPMDGVVAARNVQSGQIIASAISNVGGGTTIMTLSDLSQVFVLASVDESLIGKVKEDQEAVITADSYPGRIFPGKVVRIATKGVNNSNVVTFEVKIEVLGPRKMLLKPEMTTNVEIVEADKKDALLVPADAVTRKHRQQIVMVQTAPGKTEEREVELGITDGENQEIVNGLAEGESVVLQKEMAESRWRNAGQNRPGGPGGPGGFRPGMVMPRPGGGGRPGR